MKKFDIINIGFLGLACLLFVAAFPMFNLISSLGVLVAWGVFLLLAWRGKMKDDWLGKKRDKVLLGKYVVTWLLCLVGEAVVLVGGIFALSHE